MDEVILLIIAKTKIGCDFCYIAWDDLSSKIVRPVLHPKFHPIRWLRDTDPQLNVGEQHLFRVVCSDLVQIQYPHSTDDILVEYQEKLDTPPKSKAQLYDILDAQSHPSVTEVFGRGMENRYVDEGTECPSVGIYRCKRADVNIFTNDHDKNKKRCLISWQSGVGLTLSCDTSLTAVEDYALSDGDDVLVVLGLARPWDNNGQHNPRRCYMMTIGIITKANALPSIPPSDTSLDLAKLSLV